MSKFNKIARFIKNQVAEINQQKSGLERYVYGPKDSLPNDLLRALNDSGTATTCISRLTSFIQGEGFIADNVKDLKVNRSQTADQLLAEIASSCAVFEAFALRILFRMDGTFGSVYKIGIKELRKDNFGKIRWNYRMGEKDYQKKDDLFLREYDSQLTPLEQANIVAEEIQTHGKQLGAIMYCFNAKEFDFGHIYPIPNSNSGLEDIISDAALQRLEKRNIVKGFKPSAIISMAGKTDDQTIDEDSGLTESEELTQTLQAFTNENGASICLLEGQTKDSMPTVTVFPLAEMLDGVDKARLRVANAVCRHLTVPPVLIGLESPTVLGNSQAIANSLKVFTLSVRSSQNMIQTALSNLFPGFDFAIKQLNIYEYLPAEVLATLNSDELRALGGYPPAQTKTSSSQELLINSLNSLSPLVANKVLESLTEDEIRGLVGLGKKGGEIATTN